MPPRLQARSSRPIVRSRGPVNVVYRKTSAGTGINGHCKLIKFPTELLRQVLSYIPAAAIPTGRHAGLPILPPPALQRYDTLRVLSQTCRLWRSVFFPLLWELMDACVLKAEMLSEYGGTDNDIELALMDWRIEEVPVSWYKVISRHLEQLSKGLIADRRAAACVQVVNVSLTRCSPDTVLPAFVKCLENLPNVHTIQVFHAHSQMTTMLKTYFEGHHLPTIRTIILPDHAHQILRACPEVRKVICNEGDGSKLISAIAKECKKVEVLEGISSFDKKSVIKRLIKACPNLRQIGFQYVDADDLAVLSGLKNLARIEFRITKNIPETFLQDTEIARLLGTAKSVLNASSTKERKVLNIRFERLICGEPIVKWAREVPLGDIQ